MEIFRMMEIRNELCAVVSEANSTLEWVTQKKGEELRMMEI